MIQAVAPQKEKGVQKIFTSKKESSHSKMLGTADLTYVLHRARYRGPCYVESWKNVPHARNGTTPIPNRSHLSTETPVLCGRKIR